MAEDIPGGHAKALYEAYAEHREYRDHDGTAMQPWEHLRRDQKDSWRAVVVVAKERMSTKEVQ